MNYIDEMNKTVERIVQTVSSREVAEMMEVRHSDLLEKIEKINKDFENGKIRSQKYWIPKENQRIPKGNQNRVFSRYRE